MGIVHDAVMSASNANHTLYRFMVPLRGIFHPEAMLLMEGGRAICMVSASFSGCQPFPEFGIRNRRIASEYAEPRAGVPLCKAVDTHIRNGLPAEE